jgi:hypothetical protein
MFRMHTSIGHKNIIEKYNNNLDVFVIHPSPLLSEVQHHANYVKNDIHDIADRNTVKNDVIILKIQIINSPFSTVDDSFEIREKTKITGKKI